MSLRRAKWAVIVLICLTMAACFVLIIAAKYYGLREVLLRETATSGNALATRCLIWFGANVNAREKDTGGTALFYAAGHAHPRVIHLLLFAGADPNITDNRGSVALDWSLYSGSPESIESDKLLIDAGSLRKEQYPFWQINNSRTSVGHISMLLKYGADPNKRAGDGTTPLIFFASNGDMAAVATLVQHGAHIDAAAHDGRTALSEAVMHGNFDVVKFLVQHGANVQIKLNNRTLIQIADDKRAEFLGTSAPIILEYKRTADFLRSISLDREKRGEQSSRNFKATNTTQPSIN